MPQGCQYRIGKVEQREHDADGLNCPQPAGARGADGLGLGHEIDRHAEQGKIVGLAVAQRARQLRRGEIGACQKWLQSGVVWFPALLHGCRCGRRFPFPNDFRKPLVDGGWSLAAYFLLGVVDA